jgi:glutathione synthase/RimK-type ligase-like ATP-grasp enzyme
MGLRGPPQFLAAKPRVICQCQHRPVADGLLTGNLQHCLPLLIARNPGQLGQPRYKPTLPPIAELVLNWGSTQTLPDDLVALNQPESVRVASDQVASLARLGELAPRTVLNSQDIPLLGGERIVAKQRHGARGSGKVVLPAAAPEHDHAQYDLYQQFISDRSEYRVSVLSGRVVSAYVKHRPEGSGPDNLRPDWRYERASVLPRAVVTAAREAAHWVGLDYAGVDVVEDRSSGRVYCLEANAAPGMSEDTVRSFYAHVQQALRGRAARAS